MIIFRKVLHALMMVQASLKAFSFDRAGWRQFLAKPLNVASQAVILRA